MHSALVCITLKNKPGIRRRVAVKTDQVDTLDGKFMVPNSRCDAPADAPFTTKIFVDELELPAVKASDLGGEVRLWFVIVHLYFPAE